jgi:hypothetical protein
LFPLSLKVFYKTYYFKLCTLERVIVKITERHNTQEIHFINLSRVAIESFLGIVSRHFIEYKLFRDICISSTNINIVFTYKFKEVSLMIVQLWKEFFNGDSFKLNSNENF